MKLSKILTYVAIAFVVWWVIQQPTSAAHLVHNIGTLLSSAAHGFVEFRGVDLTPRAGISNGY